LCVSFRKPTDRRSRAQRWRDAVTELVTLQEEYRAWREILAAEPGGERDGARPAESISRSLSGILSSRAKVLLLPAAAIARRPGVASFSSARHSTAHGRSSPAKPKDSTLSDSSTSLPQKVTESLTRVGANLTHEQLLDRLQTLPSIEWCCVTPVTARLVGRCAKKATHKRGGYKNVATRSPSCPRRDRNNCSGGRGFSDPCADEGKTSGGKRSSP
jgi:hypothetical protein